MNIAKNIATELKATLELVAIVTRSESSSLALEPVGLSADTPILQVRGNFVKKVSRMLQMDDLVILTVRTQPNSLLGLPTQLVQPKAIARTHPNISVIVVHFPTSI